MMFNEGYVKIPIARYEQLRDIEKEKEKSKCKKRIGLEVFAKITDTYSVKDEKRSFLYPVMKNRIAVEIDLQELQKAVVKEYEKNKEHQDSNKVVEVTIKNGEQYTTEVFEN